MAEEKKDLKKLFTRVDIGGKERKFRFDLNALADFQEATGISLDDFGNLEKHFNKNIRTMIIFLWAGLVQYDEELTVKDVGRMMDFSDVKNLAEKVINQTIGSIQGEGAKKKVKETVPKKKKSGRGEPSSKSQQN